MRTLIRTLLVLALVIACDDKEVPVECINRCDDDGWHCNEETLECNCIPGDRWCVNHRGLDFAMVCVDDGYTAIGNACYRGCDEGRCVRK